MAWVQGHTHIHQHIHKYTHVHINTQTHTHTDTDTDTHRDTHASQTCTWFSMQNRSNNLYITTGPV